MKLRVLATSMALALGGIVVAPVAAPALSSVGVETGTKAEAALIGWSKHNCRVDRFRVASGPNYVRYRVVQHRWWTDSLTGITCRPYNSYYKTITWY